MNEFLASLKDALILKWLVITVFIVANLFVSLWEVIKFKEFNLKKLPGFITDWVLSIVSITLVELVYKVVENETLSKYVFQALREFILIVILLAFVKRFLESVKRIGWSVDTKKIEVFLDQAQDAAQQKIIVDKISPKMLEVGNMSVDDLDMNEHVDETDIREGGAM